MKNKQKYLLEFLLCLFVLFTCIGPYSYLVWDSYPNTLLKTALSLLSHIGIIALIGVFIISQGKQIRYIKPTALVVLALAILLEFHANVLGYESSGTLTIFDIRLFVVIFLMLSINVQSKIDTFRIFLYAFAICCLPSMIYFLLNITGHGLSYSVLTSSLANKANIGIFYKHYPFGIIISASWSSDRFCGIFDEAGVVGTLAAFFISSSYNKVTKPWIILLAIEGIFSFSLAFYILMIIFLLVKAVQGGFIKLSATMALLIIAFSIFMNLEFENPQLSHIQERIDFTSRYLIVDNRTSDSFDSAFQEFLKKGGIPLLFGNGGIGAYTLDARMSGSCSYKCIIYDLGIIGTIIYACIFVGIVKVNSFDKKCIPFLIVFFASLYQRPYVYDIFYITLLNCAIPFIKNDISEDEPSINLLDQA